MIVNFETCPISEKPCQALPMVLTLQVRLPRAKAKGRKPDGRELEHGMLEARVTEWALL